MEHKKDGNGWDIHHHKLNIWNGFITVNSHWAHSDMTQQRKKKTIKSNGPNKSLNPLTAAVRPNSPEWRSHQVWMLRQAVGRSDSAELTSPAEQSSHFPQANSDHHHTTAQVMQVKHSLSSPFCLSCSSHLVFSQVQHSHSRCKLLFGYYDSYHTDIYVYG